MSQLPRTCEPEVMDTSEDAIDYDRMDHTAVNQRFVDDLLHFSNDLGSKVVDLGTGTALIPILLARHLPTVNIIALDAAASMIELAEHNVVTAGVSDQVRVMFHNARSLPFGDGEVTTIISNSLVHHISEPMFVLREMVRVLRVGGVMFVRDLARPANIEVLDTLVETYTANENAHAKQLFRDSLHAALTLDEIRALVVELGFSGDDVQLTSDRHWTWACRNGTLQVI